MDYNRDTAEEKARQVGDALFSLGFAAIACWLVWTFGEPAALRKTENGVPWWVYCLLFSRFLGGIVKIMTDDTSLQGHNPVDDAPPAFDGSNLPESTTFAYRSSSL